MPLLIILIILIVTVIIRLLPKKHHDIVVDMNYEDMISNIRTFAQSLRKPARFGAGISIRKSRRRLNRAYDEISLRVKNKLEIYEFERYLYENYHLIRNLLEKSLYKGYTTLPHKNLHPRIVTISHFIVKGSNLRITKDKVATAIKAFNQFTPLHFNEISMLKSSLLYTLIQDMSLIALKSLHYSKMKRKSCRTPVINEKYHMSDSYLYYYCEKWGVPKDKLMVVNSDINIDNVENSFITALIDNCVTISNIVESIRNIDKIIDDELIIDIAPTHNIMAQDESFRLMDIDSVKTYLNVVSKISDRLNVSEKSVVEAAMKLGNMSGIHFGEFLFGNTRRLTNYIRYGKDTTGRSLFHSKAGLYIVTVTLLTITAGTAFYLMSSILPALRITLSVLIVLALIKPVEHLYSFFIKYEHRFMPRMGYKTIPPEGETMVVVSELITDIKGVTKAVRHLKELSHNAADGNVSYMLLIDLKESDSEIDEQDKEIISEIEREYNNVDKQRINFLVRKRSLVNGKYTGRERKRGALMDLSRYLLDGESVFIYEGSKPKIPEFLVLLDADNELLPGAIMRAVNSMLHPLNNKYDLLTFGCATNMHSIKTHYSKRYLNQCGIPDYGKSSDFVYDLSMNSIFCGKGIVRLRSFYDKLKDAFPNNRILSHDIIEGAVLKTGALQDRVYEDAPSNIVSDIERKSRWIRGDYQLTPYIFKRRVSIKPIYRYTILSNTIASLLPVIQLSLIVLVLLFYTNILAAFIAACILLSPVIDIIGALRGLMGTIRARYVAKSIIKIIINTVLRLLFLPFYAVNGLYLFILTMYRLAISKKNLLLWKTYNSTQSSSKFNKYAAILTPSFIVITVINALIPLNLILLTYTAAFMAYSILLYLTGKGLKKPDISKDMKASLIMYAEDIYKYFDVFVKEENNYLVPDNYQVYPYKGERYSTSPSNIGLSILSFVSAYELEIINKKEVILRIEQIIDTIVKLKKWNGHLYNWYNTKTLEVLYPGYISSVDSANFTACLIVASELMNKLECIPLGDKINLIIKETDIRALYDEKDDLFYIGYNETREEYSGHYDLIASESRILSYIATALHRDIIHWMHLSRECVGLRGNTLVSWSGTAFEYLMPEIFLDTPNYSMIGKSVINAVKEQKRSKVRGVFGISEGGFYRFDELLNYEYKAFGLRELSLRSDYSRAVITPYSSFLALPYSPKAVIANLSNLRNHAMYGEYGFYEALDMYSGEKPVNSFMAHHLGMSIASICNLLTDGSIKKLFISNYAMASARLILTEGVITNRFASVRDVSFAYEKASEPDSVSISPSKALPQHNILTNGAYAVLLDDYGNGYSVWGNYYINRYTLSRDSGLYAYIKDHKTSKVFCPSYSPMRDNISDYNVTFNSNSSLYLNKKDNFSMEIIVPPCFTGEVRKYNYHNKSHEGQEVRIAFYSELNLNTDDRDKAHPVFNDMFISTDFMKDRNALIAKRKHIDGSGYVYSALIIKGLNELRADTDRMSFIGRGRDVTNPLALSKEYNYTGECIGDSLYPCFGLFSDTAVPPKSNLEFYATILVSNSYDKLMEAVNEANSLDFVKHAEMASKVTSVNFYNKCIKGAGETLRNLTDYLLNARYSSSQLNMLSDINIREKLFRVGIEPFVKYVLLEYKGDANESSVIQYLGIIKYILRADINVRLVIIYEDNDHYHKGKIKSLKELIIREKGESIYPIIINKADLDKETEDIIYTLAFGIVGKINYNNTNNCFTPKYAQLITKPYGLDRIVFNTGEGGYGEEGNYIIKPINGRHTLLPYSNVIAGSKGGTVITSDGGGFTFIENSRENKLTVWHNDPVSDYGSEFIYLITRHGQLRINASGQDIEVEHSKGITRYLASTNDMLVISEQYIIKDGAIKVYDTALLNSGAAIDIELVFLAEIALNWREDRSYLNYTIISDKLMRIDNVRTNRSMFLKIFKGGELIIDSAQVKPRDIMNNSVRINLNATKTGNNVCAARYKIKLNKYERLTFMIGDNMLEDYDIENLDNDKAYQLEYFNNLSVIRLDSSDKKLDYLFNEFLMYQIVSSRLNARSGYYQAGGAIGFRDQLQDCLALLYSDPNYVRKHILLAAAHQYLEGDVMHWWHFERFGVRTKIKDDSIFMAYVTAEYIEATGDLSILYENVPYLESELLKEHEHSRLETPSVSNVSKPLIDHIIRAIEYVYKLGEHNLILIGGGDWNDALDCVGLNNIGESVWLSQFMYMVIMKVINYTANDDTQRLLRYANTLKDAVNNYGYDGKWYRRIYTDRGEWLGSRDNETLRIDLISQAFSVLSDIAPLDRAEQAISSAEELIDYENGVIRLLSPPFDGKNWYGYISAYPKGVRENGGQYTHAAIWYIMSLFKLNKTDMAYRLFQLINPVNKCIDREGTMKYKGEPYVLPADVYSEGRFKGRMGWNFYTGSAAWCYKMIVEEIAGIRLSNNSLVIKPKLPSALKYLNVEYRYKTTVYRIMINHSDKEAMWIDGVEVVNGNTIPLRDTGKVSEIIVSVK